MITEYGRPFAIVKKDEMKHMPMTQDGVVGICKVESLNKEFVNGIYSSMHYTPDYDKLPLVVRMWLTTWRWKEITALAEALHFEEWTDTLFYSDIVEHDEDSMLALPLIVSNGKMAICSAPRVISFDEFDVSQEVEMLE
jgi:hypothetical protein